MSLFHTSLAYAYIILRKKTVKFAKMRQSKHFGQKSRKNKKTYKNINYDIFLQNILTNHALLCYTFFRKEISCQEDLSYETLRRNIF